LTSQAQAITSHPTLTNNLISWWSFDEESGVRADSHGSLDLTDNNTVSFAAGKRGNAADFERSNSEYLSLTNAAAGSAFDTAQQSVFLWVKLESPGTTVREPFWTSWASNQGTIFYKDDSNILLLALGNGSATFDSVVWTPVADTWYHVGYTYNAGTIKFYLNGTQLGATQTTTFTAIPSSSNNYNIGKRTDTSIYADGLFDEMGVWSRALTDDEVLDLYNEFDGMCYDGCEEVSPTTAGSCLIIDDKMCSMPIDYVYSVANGATTTHYVVYATTTPFTTDVISDLLIIFIISVGVTIWFLRRFM